MATRRVARAACGLRMRNPVGNDTPEGAIIIVDDEPPVAVVEEELGHATNINPNEPSSSMLPYSGRVLFTPPWFTRRGIVSEQLRILFSTQGVVHCLLGKSSLEELIQLLDLLERTVTNLTAIGVLEILKLERLIFPTTNPSIGILLDFYSNQPSIFGYAEGLLENLKGELAYKEGFHPTVEAHSLKEGEDAALGGISLCDNEASMIVLRHHIAETEALLSRVHEEMGAFPLLARDAGFLKDRLGIRQRVFTEIGSHKE
ncbi:hypothetical protein AMTRI_Chr12g236050 [Amborella trichopoda]